MKKLYCHCTKDAHFEHHVLSEGLSAKASPNWKIIENDTTAISPDLLSAIEPAAIPGQPPSFRARVCPQCNRVMARYRTGDANSFWLDFCPACGLVWLDAGEWEQLERSGLASYLDIILTERWQKDVQSRRTTSFRDDLLRERFGAEFPEIQRFRDWLSRQSKRRDILASLSDPLSEKAAKWRKLQWSAWRPARFVVFLRTRRPTLPSFAIN